VRFKRTYLDRLYDTSNDNIKGDRQENSGSADMVAFLQAQIHKKDEQIHQLGYLLAQAQEEKKQLLLMSEKTNEAKTEEAKTEKPKRRWSLFGRKND
jgi:hypothetical protein